MPKGIAPIQCKIGIALAAKRTLTHLKQAVLLKKRAEKAGRMNAAADTGWVKSMPSCAEASAMEGHGESLPDHAHKP